MTIQHPISLEKSLSWVSEVDTDASIPTTTWALRMVSKEFCLSSLGLLFRLSVPRFWVLITLWTATALQSFPSFFIHSRMIPLPGCVCPSLSVFLYKTYKKCFCRYTIILPGLIRQFLVQKILKVLRMTKTDSQPPSLTVVSSPDHSHRPAKNSIQPLTTFRI